MASFFEGVSLKENTLHVLAGRHASRPPAQFFQNGLMITNVCATKHSVNKFPSELNFSIFGRLNITFANGSTYVLENIHIAQGHYKTVNNWWLGGLECSSLPDSHKIDCISTNNVRIHIQGEDARPNVFNLLPYTTAYTLDPLPTASTLACVGWFGNTRQNLHL